MSSCLQCKRQTRTSWQVLSHALANSSMAPHILNHVVDPFILKCLDTSSFFPFKYSIFVLEFFINFFLYLRLEFIIFALDSYFILPILHSVFDINIETSTHSNSHSIKLIKKEYFLSDLFILTIRTRNLY